MYRLDHWWWLFPHMPHLSPPWDTLSSCVPSATFCPAGQFTLQSLLFSISMTSPSPHSPPDSLAALSLPLQDPCHTTTLKYQSTPGLHIGLTLGSPLRPPPPVVLSLHHLIHSQGSNIIYRLATSNIFMPNPGLPSDSGLHPYVDFHKAS